MNNPMIFVLNRQEDVVGILKNSGNGNIPFFNDTLSEDLSTGSETFEFTTVSKNGIGKHLVVGNFIAFKKDKSYKLFQIMQTEEDHQDELYITPYCECAGMQLLNSVFRGTKLISASFERVIKELLSDTSWEVGALPFGLATTYDLDIEQESVYSLLQTYAKKYGVELEFRVEINNGRISKKFVDAYYNRGRVTGKRFTYERDIEGIVRKTDATELYTALIGKGKDGLTFRDVTVEGIDKPLDQDFVADQDAFEKYNNNGQHILGVYEDETDDAKVLLRNTYKKLQEVKKPKVQYEVSVILLSELLGEKWNDIQIGDTISIFDNAFYPPITVSARVSKLETSMTDKSANKCTLANFVEVKSNITSEMRKIAAQLQGYAEDAINSRFPVKGEDISEGAVSEKHIYRDSITTEHLQADSVTADKIDANTMTVESGVFKNLKVTTAMLEDAKIDMAQIENLKVNSGHIQDLAVGTAQIADGAINNAKIGKLAVEEANIKDASITNAKIKDLSADKITTGSIDADRLKANIIEAINMSVSGTISADKIDVGTLKVEEIDASKITSGTIDADRIGANSISSDKIQAGAITSDKIQAGEITADKLDTENIKTDFLQSNVIGAINLSSETAKINAAKISNLNADQITAGNIDADRLQANVIEAINSYMGDVKILQGKIQDLKVGTANITELDVSRINLKGKMTATNIDVDTIKIKDANIEEVNAEKITSGTLDASKITVTNLKADSIVAGAITVEGNNLIHNTNFANEKSCWKDSNNRWTVDTTNKFEGANTVFINNEGLTSDYWCEIGSENVKANENESFVGSVYVKNAESYYLAVYIFGCKDDGTRVEIATKPITSTSQEFIRHVVTGKVPKDVTSVYLAVSVNRDAKVRFAKPMLSRGTIASMWKLHNDELISNGAISNDKIAQEAITSDKLNVEELFVGENAFIKKLQATEIKASNIIADAIRNDLIDIKGLVTFESFDETMKPLFSVESGKTYINGNQIATGTISAKHLDLYSGLSVVGPTGKPTFTIAKNGDITISGLLESNNYDSEKMTGYRLTPDGKAELNQAVIRGSVELENAGITNFGSSTGNHNLIKIKYFAEHGISKLDKSKYFVDGSITVDRLGGTNGDGGFAFDKAECYKPNTKYVLSFKMKTLSGAIENISFHNGKSHNALKVYIDDKLMPNNFPIITDAFNDNEEHEIKLFFTTSSTIKEDTANQYTYFQPNKSIMSKDYKVLIRDFKLEEGETVTPWSPHMTEEFNYVRFWAGANYENRNNAPFRVYQDGTVFAHNGTFTGLLRGTLDSGDVQIYNNAFTIHSPGTETEVVRVAAGQSFLNTDVVFGNNNDKRIEYLNENKELNVNIKNTLRNSGGSFEMNYIGGKQDKGTYLVSASHKDGGKHHIKYWEGYGGLIFESEGTNQTDGKENPYDFKFERAGSNIGVNVKIQGNLEVTNSIKADKQDIEMRSVAGEGWGFYAS